MEPSQRRPTPSPSAVPSVSPPAAENLAPAAENLAPGAEFLAVINDWRVNKYGVPALRWNKSIADIAQRQADTCAWSHSFNVDNHSPFRLFPDNLCA